MPDGIPARRVRFDTLKANLDVGSETEAKKRDGPKDYLHEEGIVDLVNTTKRRTRTMNHSEANLSFSKKPVTTFSMCNPTLGQKKLA